jgi:hypothetical protein
MQKFIDNFGWPLGLTIILVILFYVFGGNPIQSEKILKDFPEYRKATIFISDKYILILIDSLDYSIRLERKETKIILDSTASQNIW